MLKKRFADIFHEKSEMKKYGKGTIVCNSMEEFDKAIEGIGCGLVSPGGTGISRSRVEELERKGLIRVFRVWVDDDFLKHDTSIFRFICPSKQVCVYIPLDDIERIKREGV